MLFNEPKLLKSGRYGEPGDGIARFSALQRAEIAEMARRESSRLGWNRSFSALQRAEIAEIV